jgi:hypothetical protein
MDKDVQQLRRVVMGHQSVQRAANYPPVGTAHNLQARAEDIDPWRYFTTQDYCGRVLKSELSYQAGKPLLNPLPAKK